MLIFNYVPILTAQVAWVGRDYGGTAHRRASIELPARIAEAIYNELDDYEERIRGQKPLIENPLSESEIRFFYRPFQTNTHYTQAHLKKLDGLGN